MRSRRLIRATSALRTYYVGTIKGVERIYLQTFIGTYAKVAFVKLYIGNTPWSPPTW